MSTLEQRAVSALETLEQRGLIRSWMREGMPILWTYLGGSHGVDHYLILSQTNLFDPWRTTQTARPDMVHPLTGYALLLILGEATGLLVYLAPIFDDIAFRWGVHIGVREPEVISGDSKIEAVVSALEAVAKDANRRMEQG